MLRPGLVTRCIQFFAVAVTCAAVHLKAADALSNYVFAADANFAWKQVGQTNIEGLTVTRVDLVSQKWRDSVWTHTVQIVRPAKVRNPEWAFLFVTGDGSGSRTLPILKAVAERAGCIAATVTKVP